MIATIGKLFGVNVPAWVVEALLALALLGSGVLYLEHRGAERELAKLEVSSSRLLERASEQIAAETSAHQKAAKANGEKLDEAIASNAAMQRELDQRVRDFDTYRRAHADVSHPAGGGVTAPGGECGNQSCADLAVRLAERGNELAGSAGETVAALQACQRDRDSLTGLPK